jgi:hypothetical protein
LAESADEEEIIWKRDSMTPREIEIALLWATVALIGIVSVRGLDLRRSWLRRAVRVAGALISLSAIAFFLNWRERCSARMPAPEYTEESPNGSYIARIVEPDADIVPSNVTRVSIRKTGSPLAKEVFVSQSSFNLHWIDDRSLEIIYPAEKSGPYCGGVWEGAKVVCAELPPAQFVPILRE